MPVLELFGYEFMQRAFLAGIAVAGDSPLTGGPLLLRRRPLPAPAVGSETLAPPAPPARGGL